MALQTAPTPTSAYQERLTRYEDTVACRRTDRVVCAPMLIPPSKP